MKKIVSNTLNTLHLSLKAMSFRLLMWFVIGSVIIWGVSTLKTAYSTFAPASWIWLYYDISINNEEVHVGDILDVHSDRWFVADGRIIWEDYLYCESDWISTGDDSSGIKRKRYKADSTTIISRGKSSSNWNYGRVGQYMGYEVQEPGTNCYIESRQEFMYNGVSRTAVFNSKDFDGYFDILP